MPDKRTYVDLMQKLVIVDPVPGPLDLGVVGGAWVMALIPAQLRPQNFQCANPDSIRVFINSFQKKLFLSRNQNDK